MKKLKICIIALRALPLFDSKYESENVIGGAEINMYNLALYFSHLKNIEVKVLVDDYGQPEVYKSGNIELVRFKKETKGIGFLKRKITAFSSFKKLFLIDADAFIFTTANSLLGILVLFHKIIRGKKVLFRLSSDLNVNLDYFKNKNGAVRCFLYKFGLKHASFIISQTDKQKELLKMQLGLESKVIENGFFIKTEIEKIEKRYILWVGRCMESKRPMLFVDLARNLPELEFVMIMPVNKEIPTGEQRKRLELANEVYYNARKLDNLKVIEYVAFDEIQNYFDKAKIYVSTSELEGFPNTFIQACLGNTPILSYSINPDGIIDNFRLGCYCGNDAVKAIEFIRNMNSDLLSEYKMNISYYVMLKHNISNTAEKYLKLIVAE